LKVQAEKDQATYDALNFRDDQFDLSDALIAIAISLLAVASLTQFPWLYACTGMANGRYKKILERCIPGAVQVSKLGCR